MKVSEVIAAIRQLEIEMTRITGRPDAVTTVEVNASTLNALKSSLELRKYATIEENGALCIGQIRFVQQRRVAGA